MGIRRCGRARAAGAVFFALVAAPRPARTGSATPANPFEEVVAVEEARLEAARGRPEAIGPLLGLAALAEVLPVGRIDAAMRRLIQPPPGTASGRAAHVLVAARARDFLAHRAEEAGDERAAAELRQPLGLLSRFWVVGPFGDGRAAFDVPFPPESQKDKDSDEELAAPDPSRPYPGKEREVSWRRVEGAMRRGALDLGALLRPDSQAAAYLQTFVRVERATDVALRLGSPGPAKVWCNGVRVHAADRVRSARFDQDAIGMHLGAGWNRILIKTVVTEGAWRVFARLTGPDGSPLAFSQDWALPPQAGKEPGGGRGRAKVGGRAEGRAGAAAPPHVSVTNLETVLRARVKAAASPGAAAQAGVELGRYLLMVDSVDRDQREAAAVFEAAAARSATVEALMGLANAGREEDESRRALERALTAAGTPRDRARVLAALGDVARDQRRPALAIERWDAALSQDSRWWPAALSLAGEESASGFSAAALARLDALPVEVRALTQVARQRARLLHALERRSEAETLWRSLLADARDNVDLMRDLAGAAHARGDGAAAVELLARAAALRPDMPSLTIEWARALEGARSLTAARQAMEDAARRLPHESLLAAELGRMLDRAGDTAGAAEWLRRALELRPQDPEMRRYAESVVARVAAGAGARETKPQGGAGQRSPAAVGGDLARRFAAAVPPLIAAESARVAASRAAAAIAIAIAKLPGAGETSKAAASTKARPDKAGAESEPDPAVVLLDRRAVRVHPNGLSEVFAQRVVQVRTDSGARDNQEFPVRYTPGSEEVEILEARIFRPDGTGGLEVLQAPERDDQDLSEPWYGLYYDYRAEVVRFEGLRPGDVLEVQYIVADVSRGNQLGGYFGDLQFVADTVPKRRWEYTLLGPRGRTFYFAKPVAPGLTETTVEEGDERRTAFAVNDVPRIEIEPAMPGLGEVSPYLHVSTYASWGEVGAWYWRLVEEQLASDDSVRRAVDGALREAEATRGGQRGRPRLTPAGRPGGGTAAERKLTVEEKVRALHALVLGGTRYVGLEFGIHGFKPYKVSQVLARKFGDCKDKAALLVTMLNQVGIDAEMVLLRTRRNGRIAPAPASLAIFDHAIAYVPSLDLYLDGTAEFSGMKELPGQDQGVMVLRVGPHGSRLEQTPVLPSSDNRAARRWDVRLRADGDAEVEEQLTISGQAAPDWRSHYQTPGERSDRYGKVWTGRNPGAHLSALDMPTIDDRNRPVSVSARATVPRLGEPSPGGGDGELSLMLGARDADLVRTYARLSSRRLDLVLAYPWQHQESIVYHLPAGFQATSLPAPRRIDTRFGHFQLRVEARGAGAVSSDVSLDVEHDRISAADYPEFRRFLADVDAVMAERIVVAREPVRREAAAR